MRRLPAIVMLLLINATLILPLTIGSAEANLAACCRRDGKHHCAKMMQAAADEAATGGVQVRSAGCPMYGADWALPGSLHAADTPPTTIALEVVQLPGTEVRQAEVRRLISVARSSQKRGPPSLLT